MKYLKQYILATSIILLLAAGGCNKDDYTLGALITPSNVTLTYEIVGADADHPYGDGSGQVNFTATASNAITYNFEFGDGQDNQIAADGKVSHVFSLNGVNTFNVSVYAIGTGGLQSTKTDQIEVFSSFSDNEAFLFLTGGTSKSWYWAADQPGHLGLGPNNKDSGDGNWTWPAWYQAAPWEKSASTLYDCELVFTNDNGNMTFEQKNPSGEAFIQGLYCAELGLGDEGSHPWDIEGVKNAPFGPSNSIATIDGAYRGTTINFSNGGFMGFYAGTSSYEIMQVTENLLTVRIVQANEPNFAWYHIFTNVKPVQK